MTRQIPALRRAGRGGGGPLLALSLLGLGLLALSPLVLSLPGSSPLPALGQEAAGATVLTPQQLLENLKAKKYSGKRIDLQMSKVSLQAVMAELEKAAGFRFDMDPTINDKVTYQIRDMPWDEALAVVLSENALRIDINLEGDGFKVYRGDRYVVAFQDPTKWKLVKFFYTHLFTIVAAAVVVAALLIGLRLYRKRRANYRATIPPKILLASDVAEETKKKLLDLLEVGKVYRQEQLSLQSLAEELSVTPHQLSWIINNSFKLSFPSLLNSYRVKDVKSRLSDSAMNQTSILQAAFEAGFSTKAAFNRAFKKFTGMTPSQFKKANHR
jgi:AraC-like DNA-binding protein